MRFRRYSVSGILFRILKPRYRFRCGFKIRPDEKIGIGFYLTGRCSPVIIGPVPVCKNWNISHSFVIERSYRGVIFGRPTIGDYIWIGPGSDLVGKISMCNNAIITPNSFMNFNVPDNSPVIGSP